MSGEKMSKSLGNSVLVSEMVQRWRPIVLRYYLGTPHYRSMIEYSEEALREAESALRPDRGLRAAGRREGRARSTRGRGAAGLRRGDGRRLGRPAGAGHRAHHRPAGQQRARGGRQGNGGGAARRGPCDARSAGPRPAGPALDRRRPGDDLHGVVDSLVQLVLDQRQSAGPARTTRPRTRSATSWSRPACRSRTPRPARAGRCGADGTRRRPADRPCPTRRPRPHTRVRSRRRRRRQK